MVEDRAADISGQSGPHIHNIIKERIQMQETNALTVHGRCSDDAVDLQNRAFDVCSSNAIVIRDLSSDDCRTYLCNTWCNDFFVNVCVRLEPLPKQHFSSVFSKCVCLSV